LVEGGMGDKWEEKRGSEETFGNLTLL